MTDTAVVVEHCPICRCTLDAEKNYVRIQDEQGGEWKAHEVCVLSRALAESNQRQNIWHDLLRALVHHLGDVVTIDVADIQSAKKFGPVSSQDDGQRVTIYVGEPRRVVLAGALPKGLPLPRG